MRRWWLVAAPLPLMAHMVSMSTGELRVEGAHARYELRIPAYEAAHARDPRTLLDELHFRSGGREARATGKSCREESGAYVCSAQYEFEAPPEAIEVECTLARATAPNHVHLLRAFQGAKTDQAVFDVAFTTAEVRFRPPPAFETGAREAAAGFMRAVGGLAPLLFMASLVLAARGRRELLISAAVFIAAEATAACAAPALAWQLSPRFIEAAAALTVAYLAFEILLLPDSKQRWMVVGALGLFHGAYFSLFLTGSGYHALPFLGGVIGGELLAIAAFETAARRALPSAWMARAAPWAAALLLTAGLAWFVMRLAA